MTHNHPFGFLLPLFVVSALAQGPAAPARPEQAGPRTADAFMEGAGAVLERMPCSVHTVEKGAALFTDRSFVFHEPPAGLQGKPFIKRPISGGLEVAVVKDGLLAVITPAPDTPGVSCSNAARLEELGFTWIRAPAVFQCFGDSPVDRCRSYQKRVKAGERFLLGKWAVYVGFNPEGQSFYNPPERVRRVLEALRLDTNRLDATENVNDIQINRPDYVVFIPRQPRDKEKRDPSKPGDTYNDHFQVLNQTNGLLFAFWTQASREADIDQHIAFSKSPDIDATDATGTWPFNTPLTNLHQVTASTAQAAAVIPNPDPSAAFRGDAATNAGSVVFNTPANSAPRAYLSTTDMTVKDTLCLTNSFTWEGWFYRTQNPGAGDWQLLFASATAPNFTSGGMNINLTYRTNGYVLYVGGGAGISDVAFGGTTDDKSLNVWRHLALLYDVSVGNGTWSLYVNGILQGSLANAAMPSRTVPGGVYVGGRPWTANSFYGAIDAVRLTKGVLAPSQFLNASAAPDEPAAPRTVAYWKLDSASGALVAASQVEPRFSFIPDAYAPAGSAAQFGRFVPVPDATEGFAGDPRANAGSAAFSGADYLRIQNLGYRLELDRAFTVEGWMLWSNNTAAVIQTLAGTRFGADYGWRLTLNTSGGTAAFRLFCQAPSRTPLLDAAFAFNAAGLAGAWHHLALTYTPRRSDTGAWELFVDGASVGSAANRFYPTTLQQSHWFILGGASGGAEAFDGLLDCWRVTEGALTPEQFLFLGYNRGTLIQLF